MTIGPSTFVLILTPLGRDGAGGIDRIMDFVREELSPEARQRVRFTTTRGRHIALSPLFMAAAVLKIILLKAIRRIDVAHINLASNSSATRKKLLAKVCHAINIPYVIHLHGGDFDNYLKEISSARKRGIRLMFERAARVIVLGAYWRDVVGQNFPEVAERIIILANATPEMAKRRAPQIGPPLILFLGQLGERKGVPQLVKALCQLSKSSEWRAVLAGDGEVKQTRAAIAAAGLQDRVDIPGWVGPEEVHRLLREACILVLPSLAENQPLSVIEAFAAELAVIATPVGATPDILRHEVNGLFVQPGDVGSLVEALTRVVEDQALRSRLASAGKAFHNDHLSIGPYVLKLAAIWRTAANHKHGRHHE